MLFSRQLQISIEKKKYSQTLIPQQGSAAGNKVCEIKGDNWSKNLIKKVYKSIEIK